MTGGFRFYHESNKYVLITPEPKTNRSLEITMEEISETEKYAHPGLNTHHLFRTPNPLSWAKRCHFLNNPTLAFHDP